MKLKLAIAIVASFAITLSLKADPIQLVPATPPVSPTIELAPVIISGSQSAILNAAFNSALSSANVLLLPDGMGFDQIRFMSRIPITSGSNAGGYRIRLSVINPALSGTGQ